MADDALAQTLLDAAAQLDATLTPAQADQLLEYTKLVMNWRSIVNLTGASTPVDFVRQHIVDCLSVKPFVNGPRVLDVGTGAGLPGLVLAIALPQLAFDLIEPRSKRARFLTQVQIELSLSNVEIIRERVQDYIPRQPYDSIIARAFGPFSRLVAETGNLQRPGVRMIAMKAAVDPKEIFDCDFAPPILKIVALDVPGFSDRNLLVLDFGE